MRVFILALLATLLPAGAAHAQSVAWNRVVAGSAAAAATLGDGRIVTRSLAADSGGNVVLTGSVTNAGARDFFTARLNAADGTLAWQKTFGASGSDDRGLSVALDAQGNAIVVGSTAGIGGTDIKVIKYAAANGAVLWERALDWGGAELGYFAAVDGAGNAIVAGESTNASGNSDVRVVKLAAATGATAWEQVEDTGRDDYVSDIAADATGDVVVVGVSRNAAGNDDIRVVKYAAANGARRWQRVFDFGGADAATALAIDGANNPIVVGVSTGATADYRTLKLAPATGAITWQKTFDGGRDDQAQAVAVDAGGNVLVSGYSQRTDGRTVLKTLKYAAADGALAWEATHDAGFNAYAYQIAVDASGNAIVAGSAGNAAGNMDWKTIVYAAANGAVLAESTHAGSAGQNDDAYAVVAVPGGAVVAGLSVESPGSSSVRVLKLAAAVATPAPDGTNVALASAGAVALASSSYGPGFPAAGAIDGDRRGLNWGSGGGWNDGTAGSYPDWLEVRFNGAKSIDTVIVFTVQDNYGSPGEPTDTLTFTRYGLVDFTVQGWNGSSWVTLGSVTGNDRVKRTVTFEPFVTDRIRVNVTQGRASHARITELEAWGVAAPGNVGEAPGGANVALASAGAVATSSSTYGAGYPASAAIDGERRGAGWGSGGGWNDGSGNSYPDWLQVDFNASKRIDRVVVYTVQDNYGAPVEPADTTTFTRYGVVDFTVEAWTGSAWQQVAAVSGNNLVKRTVTFPAVTTDRIRILVTRGQGGFSRITEVEAWGTSAATNVASAANGASASASSLYGPGYPAAGAIDGDRRGAQWGAGGGWNDGTGNSYPDWLQVNFSGTRAIDRVVVYTVQDNYANPAEPGDSLTFTRYGLVDFVIQGWNGSAWVPLGSVTGNNLVKRSISFPAFTTDRVRVHVTQGRGGFARIVEVEAWAAD